MSETMAAYGNLIEPATLKLERLLPGPIERCWAYLTDSKLRQQWVAAGEMDMKVGSAFELVWHNDKLTDPPGKRPEGFGAEHRMHSRIVAFEVPRRLVFTWGENGEVSFELQPRGTEVLLTVIHRRIPDRVALLNVSAGWHAHLDLLVARMRGTVAVPHWDLWTRLKGEYQRRFPA